MKPLPQELIDTIVDFVPDNDSLLACALTATSFVNASQRRLFRPMSINSISAYERLAAILTQSPHLGGYVRLLVLVTWGIPEEWAPLELILSTTTRVEKLMIRGRADKTSRLHHNPCLIDFLYQESLQCVALTDFWDVPSCVLAFVLETYQEVCLLDIGVVEEQDEIGADDEPTPLTSGWLRHLDIFDEANSIMPFLLQPPQRGYLTRLTHLSIGQYSKPIPDADRDALLAACAPTLQILEIEFSCAFALPTLPSLWQLELWTRQGVVFDPAVIPRAVSLALQATPRLENLTVAVREHIGAYLVLIGPVPEWIALDERLLEMHTEERDKDSSDNQITKLIEVHFSLRYFGDAPRYYEAFVSDVKRQLPRALDGGFLTFSHRASLIHPISRFSQYRY